MLMAGLDGINNKLHPGDAMDKDLYDLPPSQLKRIPTVSASLREALESQDWTNHLKRIEDADLSGIEERLREAMERLHELEDEIHIEKKRVDSDDESEMY